MPFVVRFNSVINRIFFATCSQSYRFFIHAWMQSTMHIIGILQEYSGYFTIDDYNIQPLNVLESLVLWLIRYMQCSRSSTVSPALAFRFLRFWFQSLHSFLNPTIPQDRPPIPSKSHLSDLLSSPYVSVLTATLLIIGCMYVHVVLPIDVIMLPWLQFKQTTMKSIS